MSFNKTVLVIGNGFDVDLGIKTRYSDFAGDIGFFPENSKSNLFQYMKKQSLNPNWGGIETSMEEYALLPQSEHTYEEDKKYFDSLKLSLRLFLHNKLYGSPKHFGEKEEPIFDDWPKINEDSGAYHLCYRLLHSDSLDNIITFNYTDICQYINQIGEDENEPKIKSITSDYISKRTFVHRVADIMILGISGYARLEDERYNFMKKTHQAIIPPIFDKLLSSDNIVFYGLSFSKPDYPYFKDFFNILAERGTPIGAKNIFIVSKDDNSFWKCMFEIESMLNGDLARVMNKNNITQINTNKGVNSKGFLQLLNLFPEIR